MRSFSTDTSKPQTEVKCLENGGVGLSDSGFGTWFPDVLGDYIIQALEFLLK